jgi:hypothetical protein
MTTPDNPEPWVPVVEDEARQALIDIADAIDRLTFTRGWSGHWDGHAALKNIRDYARIVGRDLPDRPLWNRDRFRSQVKAYCQEVMRKNAGTVKEREW